MVCPDNYNPADFVMFCMQTKGDELDKLVDEWKVEANNIEDGEPGAPPRAGTAKLPWIPLCRVGSIMDTFSLNQRSTRARRMTTTMRRLDMSAHAVLTLCSCCAGTRLFSAPLSLQSTSDLTSALIDRSQDI